MTIDEFAKKSGYYPSIESYVAIENQYLESDALDSNEFCAEWCRQFDYTKYEVQCEIHAAIVEEYSKYGKTARFFALTECYVAVCNGGVQ